MSKILYITYDGLTDTLGRSQILPYLEKLSEKGHQIHIVSLEKKERVEKDGPELKKRLAEKKMGWTYGIYSSGVPLLSQRKNLNALKKLSKNTFLKERADIVHCRSYLAALIGLELKEKYKSKFIFDMRGFWADERVEGKLWNLRNPIYKKLFAYFKKKELRFFNQADQVISLTEAGKNEILKIRGVTPIQNIAIIPCCADESLFSFSSIDTSKKEQLRLALGIGEKDQVVSYLGSIGTWYMLDEMLSFFSEMYLQNKKSKFLFLTPDDPSVIKAKAVQKKIPLSSIIIRSVAREEVPLYISISSFSIYFIRPTFSKRASSPTKMAELLFMGKPIVTNSGIGDSDTLFKNEEVGVVIDTFDPDSYRNALAQLPPLLSKPETHFSAVAHTYFSLEKGVEAYDKIYRSLKN